MNHINFVKEKLKIEFEFVGDEKISGFTAMKIIDDVFEQFQSEQSENKLQKLLLDVIAAYHKTGDWNSVLIALGEYKQQKQTV